MEWLLPDSELDDLDAPVPDAGSTFSTGLTARILATLFGAGATLALLTIALPHSPRANALGVVGIALIAYVVAWLLNWHADSVPAEAMPVALGFGTTLITLVAYFSAPSPSPLVFLYLWIFLYSAYFFTAREMALQIAYASASYAAVLLIQVSHEQAATWWLVSMGTLAVLALVIRVLRTRVDVLIARLFDAARKDPVTRLANRHGFRELLDLELARARRRDGKLTVIVGDLDHFKEVNDRSGHKVGDLALQRAARLLERGKRDVDAVARVGGEEFALVLPDTEEHGAFVIAERLRSELSEEFAADAVALTISFGVAAYPRDGMTAAALLRATDDALRAAKAHGGDRTMLHSPAMRDAGQLDGESRDIATERFLAVMLDLAEAIDLRFSGSARHSETVGRYAEGMARLLGLSKQR
ncbi:MAG TPA: GGDEF domain-containing protein, partial [Solirubrobacteraceae bacterium]|nr:GGDEF domain-containing protein [Solirubrobacteraceae bacterium]